MQTMTRTVQQIDEDEDITTILESKEWNTIIRKLFKENLDRWKKELLININLKEENRIAYVLARKSIINEFQKLYKQYDIELPKWLEE